MSRDMEMRCDEAVLSTERGITKPYSMALLSFATERRFPSPSPLAFGETGVKQRIKNALRWKRPKVWVTVLCALLCLIAIAACAANPSKGEGERTPTGTPWDWTSTVQLSDVKVIEESRGITLSHSQMKELIRLLNVVQEREVVRGRGIPSNLTLDITSGVGYKLRWGGGIIELDFDDAAAAAELYGGGDEPGPGVWEIHNEALYAFLEALEAPAPASASDLAADAGRTVEQLIQRMLSSDGAEAEAAQFELFQSLLAAPQETLEAVGARPEGIRDWLCWTLSVEMQFAISDGSLTDAGALLSDTPLGEPAAAAWGRVMNYVNQEQPAPKSWRQVYLDFFSDTLLPAQTESHPGQPIYGVSLMDLDFDGVPELMAWDGVASGAAFGTLYRNDGTKVDRTSERIYSTNIVKGRLSEQAWPMEDLSAFLLVRQRETGYYYWAVHDGNGQDDRAWGSYLVFDETGTEIAPYDSANKEDRTAAWEAFHSQYEVLDLDYSDFTLSVYMDGKIDGMAFNALLNRWRPVRVYAAGEGLPAGTSSAAEQPTEAWKLKVSSGGETVTAYEMQRFAETWDGGHWLAADGLPVEAALEHASEIPTLTLDWDFLVSYGTGITNRTYPAVYDRTFRHVLDCDPAGAAQLFLLEPGEYYVVFGVFGPVGRYIESEGRYEESGWDCILRLRVERQLAYGWTPGALTLGGLTGLQSAEMGSVTLSDEASRRAIMDCLAAAEAYGPTKCPFGTVLWLTRSDGTVFAICPAEDSCGVFWSGGTYYRYSGENALWALFYPESR
jgi:hypothetical protein